MKGGLSIFPSGNKVNSYIIKPDINNSVLLIIKSESVIAMELLS